MHQYLFLLIAVCLSVSCNNKQNGEGSDIKTNQETNAAPVGPQGPEQLMDEQQVPPKENPYKNSIVDVKTFKDSLGWGYDIFIDKNQYVHQPHIPAISGNRGFTREENAKKTGDFVAYKIRNNIMPPSITPHELDSLGVLK